MNRYAIYKGALLASLTLAILCLLCLLCVSPGTSEFYIDVVTLGLNAAFIGVIVFLLIRAYRAKKLLDKDVDI